MRRPRAVALQLFRAKSPDHLIAEATAPERQMKRTLGSCRISHHVHLIEFRQIVRDAEIAYAISPVVRRHRLSAEEIEKFLLELRIPRAANVAQITHRLVVNGSQKASSELAAQS